MDTAEIPRLMLRRAERARIVAERRATALFFMVLPAAIAVVGLLEHPH